MDTINSLINVMIGLITVGIVFKLANHLLAMMFNLEEKESYIKKIKNCLIASVRAISIFTIKAIIEYYFRRWFFE